MLIDSNERSCPFCHTVNNCMANSDSPCWCFEVQIPNSLTALLPAALKGKSCICISCINSFKDNPALFEQKYAHKTDSN